METLRRAMIVLVLSAFTALAGVSAGYSATTTTPTKPKVTTSTKSKAMKAEAAKSKAVKAKTVKSKKSSVTSSKKGGTVHVKGYHTKSGKYVKPYTRKAPVTK